MDNFFVKSEFVLEKFQFKEDFEIPSVRNMNVANVINIYLRLKICFVCAEIFNLKCLLLEFIVPNLSQIILYTRNF